MHVACLELSNGNGSEWYSAEEVNNLCLQWLVYCQVCCICPSVLYLPDIRQIQHTAAFQVYNMELKSTLFPLIAPTQSTIEFINIFLVCILIHTYIRSYLHLSVSCMCKFSVHMYPCYVCNPLRKHCMLHNVLSYHACVFNWWLIYYCIQQNIWGGKFSRFSQLFTMSRMFYNE